MNMTLNSQLMTNRKQIKHRKTKKSSYPRKDRNRRLQ